MCAKYHFIFSVREISTSSSYLARKQKCHISCDALGSLLAQVHGLLCIFSSSRPLILPISTLRSVLGGHVQTNLSGKGDRVCSFLHHTAPTGNHKVALAYLPEISPAVLLLLCGARGTLTMACHLPGFTQ